MKLAAIYVLGLVLASLLAIVGNANATDTPVKGKVIVVVQGFGASCTECFSVVGGLMLLEDRARAKEAARVYDALKTAMPGFDVPNAIRAGLCNHVIAVREDECTQVIVAGQADKRGELTTLKVDPNDLVVKVVIEFPRNELRVMAVVAEVAQDGKPKPADLYVWYSAPPTVKLRAAPFDATTKKNEANVSAARSYWLGGDSPELKKELLRSFDDLAEIIKLSVPHVFAERPPSTLWWNGLPKIQELKDAGTINCPKYMCTLPYLKATTDRIWHVQYAGEDVVIMSVPLSLPMFQRK